VIVTATAIPGLWIVEPEPIGDERGWFARTYDQAEFARLGLNTDWPQWSRSFNKRAGTVRGMHYQRPPHAETKLVTCLQGAILDAVIDLRPDSPSFCQSVAVELDGASGRALYIPPGLAHGFQTLADDTLVGYAITPPYRPEASAGVRWDDPAFSLSWPGPITVIADKDRAWPDFRLGA